MPSSSCAALPLPHPLLALPVDPTSPTGDISGGQMALAAMSGSGEWHWHLGHILASEGQDVAVGKEKYQG